MTIISRNMRDLTAFGTAEQPSIKTGLLYRSAHLDQLNKEELNNFSNLGIRTIIDLRRQQEYPSSNPSDLQQTDRICIPIGDAKPDQQRFASSKTNGKSMELGDMFKELGIENTESLIKWTCQNYREKVHVYRSEFVAAVKVCIDPDRMPVLFHCIGGKDRTGILAALLLDLLGFSRAQILEDYEATNLRESNHNLPQPYDLSTLPEELQHTLGHAHPQYLNTALDTIREDFGSVENYLTDGTEITPEQLQSYREHMMGSMENKS